MDYTVVTISQNLPPQRVKGQTLAGLLLSSGLNSSVPVGPEAGTFYSPVRPGPPHH